MIEGGFDMKNNFSILFWGFMGIVGYILLGICLPIVMAIHITTWCLVLYIPIVSVGLAFVGYISNLEYETDRYGFWYRFIDLIENWFC